MREIMEDGANAIIIAAAPDLLAACEAALMAYDSAPLALHGELEKMRSVVAKAKGG